MGNIWFTSDSHFLSLGAIIRDNRPFKSAYAYDKYVIDLWNKQVDEDDVIYHLGDFTDYTDDVAKTWREGLGYIKNIKAKVILVIGEQERKIIEKVYDNNFESFRNYCLGIGFEDVLKDKTLEIDDLYLYLNHLPSKYKKGFVNLSGYTHRISGLINLYSPLVINVGCDLNHFQLFSLDDIKIIIKMSSNWEKDKNIYK